MCAGVGLLSYCAAKVSEDRPVLGTQVEFIPVDGIDWVDGDGDCDCYCWLTVALTGSGVTWRQAFRSMREGFSKLASEDVCEGLSWQWCVKTHLNCRQASPWTWDPGRTKRRKPAEHTQSRSLCPDWQGGASSACHLPFSHHNGLSNSEINLLFFKRFCQGILSQQKNTGHIISRADYSWVCSLSSVVVRTSQIQWF